MRKIYLFVIVLLSLGTTSYGQFQKGNLIGTGTIRFNNTKTDDAVASTPDRYRNVDLGFGFSIGKFISEREFNSIGLGYAFRKYKFLNNAGYVSQESDVQAYALSFGRTTLFPLASRFFLTVPVIAALTYQRESFYSSPATTRTITNNYIVGLNGSLGLMYQTKKKWILSCTLPALAYVNFRHAKSKQLDIGNGRKVADGFSNSVGIGANVGTSTLSGISVSVSYQLR